MTFKKGKSGNPEGRRVGTGHRQQLFNALVEPHKAELFHKAISLALAGNESMLRLFLERMLPAKLVDNEIRLEIDNQKFTQTESLLEAGGAIIQGVINSKITPQEARTCMSTLESQSKQIATYELSLRVAAIEQVLKLRKERGIK